MIFTVQCPQCLRIVGCQPPVKDDEKSYCCLCNSEIDADKGKWIQEPIEPEKEIDLLSID